ncbi:ADP-ribosylglycohydrolase family protein [Vibrio mediterranei]|uniref:ADP-ribosylglycohydrolase family protein n=1 Tax=Vibrio TaxID=662 RepID=UPI0001540CEE|nr:MULTISPECIES: ADP-ribosylglycohydrolase family protein [Vibrio]EDL55372.1 putative hydrolase [Vibrio mediterranei AK1]MCG9788423.1 ADP-ribosylglycohydrolase family protein [Vibrio mediterranei]USE03794.1 ADP-ribosylglycohydrolase family protein [Vibrio sp. SCSIO 43133]
MTITKQDRILGTFYGQALGDSMGMPSELWPRSRVKAHFGWIDRFLDGPEDNNAACYFKACQFTDDTSMALALADAIIECDGQIVPEVIARNVLTWAEGFDAFNKNIFGPSSKAAMRSIKEGVAISELENNGVTNGAAMRVSPMGCLLPTNNHDDFIEQVALASSPTHKSDVAISGAVIIAWAISKAIEGHSWTEIKDQLPAIAHTAQTKNVTTFSASMASRVELALQVAEERCGIEERMEKIYNLVGAGVSTIESVPAAIAMVELAETDPNRCAILCANLGGDTDTIGAMATAICGALNGIQAIDAALKQQLDNENQLNFEEYACKFLSLREAKEQGHAS